MPLKQSEMGQSEQDRAASVGPHQLDLPEPPPIPWDMFYKTDKYKLNKAQKDTIRQICWKEGGAGILAVGHGKSLLIFLMGTLFGIEAEDILLLHPKNLERTLVLQHYKFKDDFHLVKPRFMSYETLQGPMGPTFLNRFRPKLILADEVQAVRNPNSVRCRRLIGFIHEYPETMFIPFTGTISNRSLKEYAHILLICLREGCPLPINGQALLAWCRLLDVKDKAMAHDYSYFRQMENRYGSKYPKNLEGAKKRRMNMYRDHLHQTPGLTLVGESSVASTLYLRRQDKIEVPTKIKETLKYMDEEGRLPAIGAYFESDSAAAIAASQVIQGFYYKWVWEDNIDEEQITDWKLARGDWDRSVRDWMRKSPGKWGDDDAPRQLVAAIQRRDKWVDRHLIHTYHTWMIEKRRTPAPKTVGVWLDDYLVDWAGAWVRAHPPALVWYRPKMVGLRLAQKLSLPHYAAGNPPPEEGMKGTGTHSAAVVTSHRRGLNLQAWQHHLIFSPFSSGSLYEQTFGRSHRAGQTKDVFFDIITHHHIFKRRLDGAMQDARGSEEKEGMEQKLNYAAWI